MGLCNSPDIFQKYMGELVGDLEHVRAYIDDLLIISKGTYEDHLEKLEELFRHLQDARVKVNAIKPAFGKTELEYLGYWVTREGVQHMPNKVEASHSIATPKPRKQLRSFIGLINSCRGMWVHRSDLLAPLSKLTSSATKWK